MARLWTYHSALFLDAGGLELHAWTMDVWRAVECWSIVTTRGADEWPPSGCMGRRDDETIYWETDDGRRFLFPYETVVDLMNGDLTEATATEDMQKGPARPKYRVVTRTMEDAERRDRSLADLS
ncbi:MAG: hypothetical protein WC277_09835 [Bacilli bacterium]